LRGSEKSGNCGSNPSPEKARARKRETALPEKGGLKVGESVMDDDGLSLVCSSQRFPAAIADRQNYGAGARRHHFNDVLILPKLLESLVPTP
jgi:hypothetical protein